MSPLQHLTQVSSWLALYSCECEWGEGGREKGMKRERERERERERKVNQSIMVKDHHIKNLKWLYFKGVYVSVLTQNMSRR